MSPDDDSSVDSVPSDTPLSALGKRKYCTSEADNCTVAVTGMTDVNGNVLSDNVAGVPPIIHEPPLMTLNFVANNSVCKPTELDWLNDDLHREISQWKPSIMKDTNSDIAVNGGTILNVERLQEAFASVFWTDRTFYNFYQAHALGQELANIRDDSASGL